MHRHLSRPPQPRLRLGHFGARRVHHRGAGHRSQRGACGRWTHTRVVVSSVPGARSGDMAQRRQRADGGAATGLLGARCQLFRLPRPSGALGRQQVCFTMCTHVLQGPFDLGFDYTFLCALHPDMRRDWAPAWGRLLRPGGLLLTLIFPVDSNMDRNKVGSPQCGVETTPCYRVRHGRSPRRCMRSCCCQRDSRVSSWSLCRPSCRMPRERARSGWACGVARHNLLRPLHSVECLVPPPK